VRKDKYATHAADFFFLISKHLSLIVIFRFKTHLRTHNIDYNEEIHGFKESSRSVLMSGLKVVPPPDSESNNWMGLLE
jgi:hypothetical protein